jgi:hypothetical protein
MARRDDLLLVGLAALHAAAVVAAPSLPLIAIGVWWNSNTIAHNFVHRPFFRSRALNVLFGAGQSVLMGIPQTLWRDRHLAHHADVAWRLQWSSRLAAEVALVATLWAVLVSVHPGFFVTTYVPGYLAGLGLCALQGHYEHAGATTSHYGRLYNVLCFNDGYHVEHHAYPGVHWTALPARRALDAPASAFPPLLRWVGPGAPKVPGMPGVRRVPGVLDSLERVVLGSALLQRFVLHVHRQAFRALLKQLPPLQRIAIVGGGLFPRTALVLRELAPRAEIVVIDSCRAHVEMARRVLGDTVRFEQARFSADDNARHFDLLVIPLAFRGDRAAIYQHPPAPAVLVHDWLWRRRGQGRLVSWALLKRINLVRAV